MSTIQIVNPVNATNSIIIPLKLNRVTSYFDVRKTTLEEYENQDNLKIELTKKISTWDPSSPDLSR